MGYYNWFTWILCCLYCRREKFNSTRGSYYKYGKTYSPDYIKNHLIKDK